MAGERVDADEAGRPGRIAGEPAWDVREGLEAGRMGRRVGGFEGAGRRVGLLALGTLRADIRDGLDSREVGMSLIRIQLVRRSPDPLER